ncbi:hypothetical protein CAPTEDRAFT_196963 [Capitella teleta]|uniref:Uncharacterized protein n=1 Tax=Capitella teleta TaxID=283909 RepID=R7TB87_CAPTE|nr:hypothetical protein CAPTEDRAFT_196963 [Capitella teleta]|eukprot:ELT90974.1 hypothetical protein CAPTEDRAFT_196963 [Capitella teleta]
MGTLRDDHREVRPPTYTDVVNSTRYPILRPRLSSEPSIDMEATEQTLVIPAVGLMIPPPGGVRLPLPEQAGPPWRLRFVDFTPHLPPGGCSQKRSLNNFNLLVSRANMWLQSNGDVRVFSCETVTWWANSLSKLNETELVNSTIKPSNKLYFMRGLRLWVIPAWDSEVAESDEIGIRDFEPDMNMDNELNLATFVKIVNNKIQEEPLAGRPLKMETLTRRSGPNAKAKDCYWTEMPNVTHTYLFFFRCFYLKGSPCRDLIGVKDFRPERLYTSNRKYEPYERVAQKAKDWIAAQMTVKILNLQTIMLKRKEGKLKKSFDKLMYTVHRSEPVAFLQTLRLYFVRPRYDVRVEVLPSLSFSKKTFAPQKKPSPDDIEQPDEVAYESFSKTVEQVSAWLKNTRSSMLSIETAHTRLRQEGPKHNGAESTLFWSFESSTENWLTHVRIFIADRASRDPTQSPPTPRYLNFTPVGQPWYMRRRSFSSTRRNKRCLIAVGVLLTITVLLGTAGILYYFYIYK